MGKYSDIYNSTFNENYELSFCPIKNNSWDFDENGIKFKGRPASSLEKKCYNLQRGVVNDDVSIYIYSSNLPENIKPEDKVLYLGKTWTVESVGYYFYSARFVDPSCFDEEYIKARCAKGITIK